MAFNFFENAIAYDADYSPPNQLPEDMYRDLQQNYITDQWDNTSALITVEEQSEIGSDVYNEIEVWITPTVGDTSTGLKDTFDFNKLIFESIDHRTVRGLMYHFDDNYWIVHAYTYFNSLAQDCGIRRCNNRLKMIDPENGAIFSIPCVVDYDMASPSQQTSRYIITPNNHANIICQANDDTLRLFKTNTRFILSGRPFKLTSYQNALGVTDTDNATIFYLDLYLDEIHANDDIENGIADNGEWEYSIVINSTDIQAITGFSGELSIDITLNGLEVDRDVIWTSSDEEVVTLEDNVYTIVGATGDTAEITVTLDGNTDVSDSINLEVVDESDFSPTLVINPVFNKIRQYETIDFTLEVDYGGETYTEFDEVEFVLSDDTLVNLVDNGDYTYSITGLSISEDPIQLTVSVTSSSPSFSISESYNIYLVSMFG